MQQVTVQSLSVIRHILNCDLHRHDEKQKVEMFKKVGQEDFLLRGGGAGCPPWGKKSAK